MRPVSQLFGVAILFCTWSAFASDAPVAPAALAQRLLQDDPPLVLDVRTPEEFADGHIPGALLIPHDRLEQQLAALGPQRDREIVLYCRSGRRSLLAEQVLRDHGFTQLRQLDGSWLAWDAAGLPRVADTPARADPSTEPSKDPSR